MLKVAVFTDTVLHLISEGLEHIFGLFKVKDLSIFDHHLLFKTAELFFGVGRDGAGDSLEGNINGTLLLSNLCFKLLLFGLSFWFLLLCWLFTFALLLVLLFGSSSWFACALDGNLFFLSPKLAHLNAIKFRNLVDVVLDAN